ncbi:MAG: biotin transporter BioY [Selenomonadaceae bacterium]|nr:biotin transporter BioY [Selenomonadaceae bacterium]
MAKLTAKELALCGLFIALITAGTMVRIPVGGDVYTLQFLFTLLAGLMLGAKIGAVAVAAYVFMGLIGIPVFAVGGGPGYVLQPTFGYLLGFILQAYLCGYLSRRVAADFRHLLFVNLLGMAVVYVIGIGWFYAVSNFVLGTTVTAWAALFYCGILQAPPDFLLCMAAAYLALRAKAAGFWL